MWKVGVTEFTANPVIESELETIGPSDIDPVREIFPTIRRLKYLPVASPKPSNVPFLGLPSTLKIVHGGDRTIRDEWW